MSRRSHKNFRKCGGPPIIGQGELSEFDASANAGLFVSAPRWPLLASAPATVVNGQRFRLAEAGLPHGREYLWRSVVRLPGYQNILIPTWYNTRSNFGISFLVRDVTAGASVYSAIMLGKDSANNQHIMIFVNTAGKVGLALANDAGEDVFWGESSKVICDGLFHKLDLIRSGDFIHFLYDGVEILLVNTVFFGWTISVDIQTTLIAGESSIIPLEVCNIQQSFNGTLIDNIPCTETSGTELANTVTPSRPATLSDANAHAIAAVPQDNVTMDLWLSNGIEWVVLP